jgi:hypothetical protein
VLLTISGRTFSWYGWLFSAVFGATFFATCSSAAAESANVSNLSIVAIANPGPADLLYPGGSGDVVVAISNPNSFPVTISAVQLPTSTTFATGYLTSGLSVANVQCDADSSFVYWSGATSRSASSHRLAVALTVAAADSLVVTFVKEARMGTSSPSACEGSYFSMPSLLGVTATASSNVPTPGPTSDSWSNSTLARTSAPVGRPVSPSAESPALNAAGSSGSGTRMGGVFDRLWRTLRRAAAPIVAATAFTFAVLPFILVFLLVQRRIDANDPKLAAAPVFAHPGLPFSDVGNDESLGLRD